MAFTICVLTASRKREQYIAHYLSYEEGVTGHQALADFNAKLKASAGEELELDHEKSRVIGWFVNNYTRPLGWVVDDNAMVEFIQTTSPAGLRIYQRSLDFLLVIACERVLRSSPRFYPQRKVTLRHSIGEGHYWEFEDGPVTQEDVDKIRAEMQELVRQDLPFTREVLTIDKARRVFHEQGDLEMAELFGRANLDPIEVYRCRGRDTQPVVGHTLLPTGEYDLASLEERGVPPVDRYGYFCGTPLAPSTGMLRTIDIVPFARGMVLLFPTVEMPEGIPPFQVEPSVGDVFFDYARWLDVLNLNYLNKLHHRVTDNKIQELILISEAFHSQRLGNIAEDIASRPVKVVTIAGPSGSGKTTFSERLSVVVSSADDGEDLAKAVREAEDEMNAGGRRLVYLEIGVGGNTPGIIKYPFWLMVAENPNAFYAQIDLGNVLAPTEIADRTMLIDADAAQALAAVRALRP